LIRRFKATTTSFHDSYVGLYEKNEVVYKDKGYFGAKSKGYNATMKRTLKEHFLEIRNVLRNKRISSRRVQGKRVYAVTEKVILNRKNSCHYYSKSESKNVVRY
jgi:transposase, IS5 family